MPELPEVETVRLQLKRKIVGEKITGVEIFHSKSVDHNETFEDTLVGKVIQDIERIGKLMIFRFKGEDDLFMLSHLKMTGQFFFIDGVDVMASGHQVPAQQNTDFPQRHTRVAFYFSNSTALYFNDMRLFGYLKLANKSEMLAAKARFGPEPIAKNFDCDWFYEKLKKRNTPVKAALLDQTFIAGLGNIYVDEALWRAKVRPMRIASKVTKAEAALLCKAAGDVMNESIVVGGTTFQHFVDTGGANGNFTDYLKVFGQQGTACPRKDGGIIEKTRCAGRGTHYCPVCQK